MRVLNVPGLLDNANSNHSLAEDVKIGLKQQAHIDLTNVITSKDCNISLYAIVMLASLAPQSHVKRMNLDSEKGNKLRQLTVSKSIARLSLLAETGNRR